MPLPISLYLLGLTSIERGLSCRIRVCFRKFKMDNETPLYNCRLIRLYIEYLNKYYPDIDTDTLLDYAGISKYEIVDPG